MSMNERPSHCPVCRKPYRPLWSMSTSSMSTTIPVNCSYTITLDSAAPPTVSIPYIAVPLNTPYTFTLFQDNCQGTGECASKHCTSCGWYIPRWQEHTPEHCAELAGYISVAGQKPGNGFCVVSSNDEDDDEDEDDWDEAAHFSSEEVVEADPDRPAAWDTEDWAW